MTYFLSVSIKYAFMKPHRKLQFVCRWTEKVARVLNVPWPCKYLPEINCRQRLFRGREGSCREGERLQTNVGPATYHKLSDFFFVVWFVQTKFSHFSGLTGLHAGISLSFWACVSQKAGEERQAKKGKWLSSLAQVLLPVWESLKERFVEGVEGWETKRVRQEEWKGCCCQKMPSSTSFLWSVKLINS